MSSWTITLVDPQSLLGDELHARINSNVDYLMAYLDRFIDWKGTLDVDVNIKTNAELTSDWGWTQDGIIPATEMSWVTEGGRTFKSNLIEMTTGEDRNGAGADAGFTIYLGRDGTIRNYGYPVWLDPDPVFDRQPAIPQGHHDFVSIALHELLHTIAFDRADLDYSTLGSQVTLRDGVYYFEGEHTVALLGRPLALDEVGHVISSLVPQYAYSGMVSDSGNYEQNRWDIGRIELAVMKDLGIDVHHSLHGLPYTDLDDKNPHVTGTAGDDVLFGDFHDNIIRGGAANDVLEGGAGDDLLDGGPGRDTALYAGLMDGFDVTVEDAGIRVIDRSGAEGSDRLEQIERIHFADKALAFDLDGNAGMAYRIYQAAFDRTPDLPGLGYWIAQMDRGAALTDLARGFIQSEEFVALVGPAPAAPAFITKLYSNILHREPDGAGFDFWVATLAGNDSLAARASVLAEFSESGENVANMAELVGIGIVYQPYA